MFRKIIFQAHWLVGITLGAVLVMSGVTGGTMAFDKEISNFLLGYYDPIEPHAGNMLSAGELYTRVHVANPKRVIAVFTPAIDAQHAAQIEFAAADSLARGGAGINSGDDRNDKRLVDPYTGSLLPESLASQRVQVFMAWLRQIHQGHWLPPSTAVGAIIYNSVGIGAVFLFGMALSGLYLRWPRGRAARSWRSWLKINMQLKGRAFLWNLHTVLGTVVLLAYLVSAHTGAFQNGTVAWYGHAVRTLFGIPQVMRPEGPLSGDGPPGPGAGPGLPAERPPSSAMQAPAIDDAKLWTAFIGTVPAFKTASIHITRAPDQAAQFVYVPVEQQSDATGVDTGVVEVDTIAGTAKNTKPAEMPALSFGERLAANNQDIHEGRIFGKAGVAVMMFASLSMPVFYITGWMMYLKRRKRRTAPAVAIKRNSEAVARDSNTAQIAQSRQAE